MDKRYWTFEEFKATREKINPVSIWFGKQPRDKRPLICQYIDALVMFLALEDREYTGSLDFTNLG